MKKIIFTVLIFSILIQTNFAQEVLNLNCINKATQKISEIEIQKIVYFTQENKKILVLPFYSKDEIYTEVSVSIAMNLTTALQQEIQKKNKNLTFYYPDEYNKQGNKIINKYHLTVTDNVNDYWKGIIKRFNPDFYIDGYYFIEEKNEKYFLTLKTIFVKPNDLNNETGLKKIALNPISIEITDQEEIEKINKIKNKNTFVFVQTDENLLEQPTQIIKKQLTIKLYDTGVSVENFADSANYKIIVNAKAREFSNPYENAFFSYVDAQVEILNLNTNKIIYENNYTEKGGSTISYEDAANKAYITIADNLSKDITNYFITKK